MTKAKQATITDRRRLLVGLTATGGAYGGAQMSEASSATSQAPGTDAELIALCAAHPALIAAVNNSPIDFDECPAWQAYEVSRDAIHDAQPQTLAGMRAKALAAKAEARNPDGDESPGNGPAEHWAWDLVNDLLRLTGDAA